MTFTARREPTFHAVGPDVRHDGPLSGGGAAAAHGAGGQSGFMRFVSTLQLAGTLLGVPIALGSGYSIYRANFSVETTCQNLRGNIIAMLDRSVDAATRRILVRRDVAAFEQSCGGFDPDAQAAFKALLAVDRPVSAPAGSVPKARAAAPPAEIARKPEPRPAVAAKQPVASGAPVTAEASPEQREAGVSDTKWLAAVRQALVSHDPEQTEPAKAVQPAAAERPLRPLAPRPETLGSTKSPAPILQPAWTVPALPPVASPPAESAPAARAPQQDADHPVPPGSIPASAPASDTKEDGEERGGSRLVGWIAQVPLLGRVIERGRD